MNIIILALLNKSWFNYDFMYNCIIIRVFTEMNDFLPGFSQ